MPSFAAKTDAVSQWSKSRLLATMRYMGDSGVFGIAWLDESLCAFERYGRLVDDIPLGVPINVSMSAFIGLDDEIKSLRGQPKNSCLAIPNVLVSDAGRPEKVSFNVYWVADLGCYLLVVVQAASPAEIEYRLAAEVRARAIAEAEIAAQARVVQRMNQELGIANRDLQEFASVISHDLRAPLRGLRYAASDARAAIAAGDPEAAERHLEQTISLARRMGAMLTGLLDYARAGRKTDVAERVDTSALTREIAESIGAGTGQSIVVEGEWPVLVTLAEPLDLVLRNLIDNAVKHHDREDGRILVSARPDEEQLMISVADDGPGIDPAWHKAIFLPFKQIGDSDEVDGAGIGLALVKKTVERFGGSVEVESDPAQRRGTTFRVAWPRFLAE